LSQLFARAADEVLPSGKASAILEAAWRLPSADRLDTLIDLLTIETANA
jgi:hypothetical protein